MSGRFEEDRATRQVTPIASFWHWIDGEGHSKYAGKIECNPFTIAQARKIKD